MYKANSDSINYTKSPFNSNSRKERIKSSSDISDLVVYNLSRKGAHSFNPGLISIKVKNGAILPRNYIGKK